MRASCADAAGVGLPRQAESSYQRQQFELSLCISPLSEPHCNAGMAPSLASRREKEPLNAMPKVASSSFCWQNKEVMQNFNYESQGICLLGTQGKAHACLRHFLAYLCTTTINGGDAASQILDVLSLLGSGQAHSVQKMPDMIREQKRHIKLLHIKLFPVAPVTGPPGRVPGQKDLCSLRSEDST